MNKLKKIKKLDSINEINNDELKEQLKTEFKDEKEINSFLSALDFNFEDLEACYLNGWNNGESDKNTSYKMALINEKIKRDDIEIYKVKEIILNDESYKMRILRSKSQRLIYDCNKEIISTDIAEIYGTKDIEEDNEIISDFYIGEILKDTYQYIYELFITLHFLGLENGMKNHYYINKFSNVSSIRELDNLKKEICFNDIRYMSDVMINLLNLTKILDLINVIKNHYDDLVDYGSFGMADVSNESYAFHLISNFQEMIIDFIEKLRICLDQYLPYYEKMDELRKTFKGLTILGKQI